MKYAIIGRNGIKWVFPKYDDMISFIANYMLSTVMKEPKKLDMLVH
jgi:hypothetical protein